MKIRYYLPVLCVIFLASCSSEENGLGPENASDQINEVAGELNDDVVTLVQSDGVDGALTLIDLIDNSSHFGRIAPYQMDDNRAYVTNQIGQISYSFTTGIARLLNEEPADFVENKGVYEWNFDLEDFEKTEESDFIIIHFPTEGSTTNNAKFRLTEFTVVEIDFEELPTSIKADLTIDEDPLVEEDPIIDLVFAVNYDTNGNPETADISLDVIPFALEVDFDDTETSTTSLAVTLLLEGENLVGVDVDVEFDTADKLEPVFIEGYVQYLRLKILGDINLTFNIDTDDPNDFVNLELLISEEKAGDIVYDEDLAYVQYSDGSRELLEEILQPVIDEIDQVIEDIG